MNSIDPAFEAVAASSASGGETAAPTISIWDLLWILRRHWFVVLATVCVVSATWTFWTMRQPKVYQAHATIVLNTSEIRPLGRAVEDVADGGGGGNYWLAAQEYRKTQMRIMTSPAVLRDVAERLALDQDDDFLGLAGLPPEIAEARRKTADPAAILQPSINVDIVRDSMLVVVGVDDRNPERAARIANTLIDSYSEYALRGRSNTNREATAWLGDKLIETRDNLAAAENKLYEFEQDNDILAVSFNDRREILSERMKQLSNDLYAAQARLTEAQARYDLLKQGAGDPGTPGGALAHTTAGVSELMTRVDGAKAAFDAAVVQYGPLHPEYRQAKAALDSATKLYNERLQQPMLHAQATLDEARTIRAALQGELDETQRRAFDVNKLSLQYNRLRFEADNYRELYSLLLKRSKESELIERVQFSNVQMIEPAKASRVPIYPRTGLAAALSTMIGLLLGVLMALAADQLDRKVKSTADAERLTGVPNLGSITHVESEAKPKEELIPVWQEIRERSPRVVAGLYPYFFPRSATAESSRIIRTNLLLMDPDSDCHVLSITSALPQEGKSTVTTILGTIMASLDQRVLLVDTDLRRPTLNYLLDDRDAIGISNWIVGDATLEQAVHHSVVPALDLIPSGPPPPNPTEILHSERMYELLEFAKKNYQFVIFDSPPIGLVSDALLVATLTRRVLLVVDPDRSDRHLLRSASRQLRDIGVPLSGFVLNNVERERARYGYSRYSYYSYRYGYGGYGQAYTSEAKS